MLKITLHDSPEALTFQLEGKLVGAYARELEQSWLTAASTRGSRTLGVDLREVDFIDDEGRRVLSILHEAGAEFYACGPLTSSIVEAVTGRSPAGRKESLHSSPNRRNRFAHLVWIAILGVLLLFSEAKAQNATPVRLTLRDAIQLALKQNPQVVIANLNIAEAQQTANISRSALLPDASLQVYEAVRRANIQAQLGIPFPNFPKHIGPFFVFQGGPNFSIPVLDLTAYRRWRAAREDVSGSRAEQVSVREQNVQLVVSQYLGTLRSVADVTAARSRMDVAKALLDLATDLQRNGAGTRIDTLRADVQYQNERQNVLVAETQFKTSVYALARLLNIDPRTPMELADQASFFETPAFEGDSSVEAAFANRPELQAIESRLRGLELQRRAASDQRLPRLSITGGWAEQGLSPSSAIPTYNYQGNLDIPLFTGGRIRAQQAVAGLEVQKAEQDRQDTRNRVAVEVQTALAQLESARNEVDVANHALDLAREELGQARDRFQAGVANNIEVIQAQDEVARANDNQIQALFRYNQARADLARATGQIERIYTK
jgi:outer membrane protein TolC